MESSFANEIPHKGSLLTDDNDVSDIFEKLVEMRKERQAAQERAQRIENRVNLLQKDKVRAMKKIEQVRDKARAIMQIKERTEALRRQKEEAELRRQLELNDKHQRIYSLKLLPDMEEPVIRLKYASYNKVVARESKEVLKVGLKEPQGEV